MVFTKIRKIFKVWKEYKNGIFTEIIKEYMNIYGGVKLISIHYCKKNCQCATETLKRGRRLKRELEK